MSKSINPNEGVRVTETIGFTLEGITVFTHIDYRTRQVSLVEKDGGKKQWLFHNRTPDYFAGWQNILKAMSHAVSQAEARLNEQPSLLEQALIAQAKGEMK